MLPLQKNPASGRVGPITASWLIPSRLIPARSTGKTLPECATSLSCQSSYKPPLGSVWQSHTRLAGGGFSPGCCPVPSATVPRRRRRRKRHVQLSIDLAAGAWQGSPSGKSRFPYRSHIAPISQTPLHKCTNDHQADSQSLERLC